MRIYNDVEGISQKRLEAANSGQLNGRSVATIPTSYSSDDICWTGMKITGCAMIVAGVVSTITGAILWGTGQDTLAGQILTGVGVSVVVLDTCAAGWCCFCKLVCGVMGALS